MCLLLLLIPPILTPIPLAPFFPGCYGFYVRSASLGMRTDMEKRKPAKPSIESIAATFHMLAAHAVQAEERAEQARREMRAARQKYKQAKKAYKKAKQSAKQARKDAKSAAKAARSTRRKPEPRKPATK